MATPTLDELTLLHANICRALGDPKRIQILYLLAEAPRNVTALAEALEAPQPTVSRHLTVLRERGLVATERDGTSIQYSLADSVIIGILDDMRELLRRALERQAEVVA